MFVRTWNFIKRHRKKFIFTGLLAGGAAYAAWRAYQPQIQELRSLMQAMGALGELARSAEGEQEEDRKARFQHTQEVSDKFARKSLPAMKQRLESCFFISECASRLKEAKVKEEKLERFSRYGVECLALSISALYALVAHWLLNRVEYNISGRELDANEAKAPAAASSNAPDEESHHTAFLESVKYFEEEGLPRIAGTVRQAVAACCKRGEITPQTEVTEESLRQLLLQVCQEVHGEVLLDKRSVDTLLPDSIEKSLSTGVKPLLDEARDYLESPRFVQVFEASIATAVEHITGVLGNSALGASGQADAPKSCALAKLYGSLIQLCSRGLEEEGAVEILAQLAVQPTVAPFCEEIYFQATR